MVILKTRNKLIVVIIAVLITTFIVYQYYASVYTSISTESAVSFEQTDGIDGTATFIRNEVTVSDNTEGTVHFLVANGEKIASGGTIANIYENDSASAAASRIVEIDKQLDLIADIEGYNDSTAVDVDTINERINDHLNSFIYKTSDSRFSDLGTDVADLLTMMTRKQVAIGEQNDFSLLKDSLTKEKESLKASVGTPKSYIYSDTAGYFVSNADGYETKLTTEDLSIYTPEYLKKVKEESVGENVIGKIVYDYEWYIAVPVTLNDSRYFRVGDTLDVKTNISSGARLSTVVECINISEKGDEAILILRCNEMNSDLASVRTADITVVKKEYSGIMVKSDAIRIVDGKTGVYVVSGIEAKFVETEIIFSDADYHICTLNTSDSSKLRLYDKIIVKGRNLYDGKIIY